MVEKVMVCDDCGKMFKIEYDMFGEKELKCPGCEGTNVISVYKKMNIEER